MGISRESFGQIRDILRKLDNSIDSAREKRLKESERRREERARLRSSENEDHSPRGEHGLDQRIG